MFKKRYAQPGPIHQCATIQVDRRGDVIRIILLEVVLAKPLPFQHSAKVSFGDVAERIYKLPLTMMRSTHGQVPHSRSVERTVGQCCVAL